MLGRGFSSDVLGASNEVQVFLLAERIVNLATNSALMFVITMVASIRSKRAGQAIVTSFILYFGATFALGAFAFGLVDVVVLFDESVLVGSWFAIRAMQCVAIFILYKYAIRAFARKMNAETPIS